MPSRVAEAIAGLSVVVFGLLLVEIGSFLVVFGLALGIVGLVGAVVAAVLPDEENRKGSALERPAGQVLP